MAIFDTMPTLFMDECNKLEITHENNYLFGSACFITSVRVCGYFMLVDNRENVLFVVDGFITPLQAIGDSVADSFSQAEFNKLRKAIEGYIHHYNHERISLKSKG